MQGGGILAAVAGVRCATCSSLVWVYSGRLSQEPAGAAPVCAWGPGFELPILEGSHHIASATRFRAVGDEVLYPVGVEHAAAQAGEWAAHKSFGVLYSSSDRGRSWATRSTMGAYQAEMDVLNLDQESNLVVAMRYQTPAPGPGPPLPPEVAGLRPRYKQSAVQFSSDFGFSWSAPRVVTGYLQQSACLVQTRGGSGDRALVLVFGYKGTASGKLETGQRFIVSYSNGTSWSNRIFQLHSGGMYASSVATADDTIVTVFAYDEDPPNRTAVGQLQSIRWRLPPRETVAADGFFAPPPLPGVQEPEPAVVPTPDQ